MDLSRASECFPDIEVKVIQGRFEDNIGRIRTHIGSAFCFAFIDPTNWTVDIELISPLLRHKPSEMLFTFMFDFVNRFKQHPNDAVYKSYDLLFGDPGWRNMLDSTLPMKEAIPQLFDDVLRKWGGYTYVAHNQILKTTSDRAQYFLHYGTRHLEGLVVFRDIQRKTAEEENKVRVEAKRARRVDRTGQLELLTQLIDPLSGLLVSEEKELAKRDVLTILERNTRILYDELIAKILSSRTVTVSDIKQILRDEKRKGRVAFTGLQPTERVPKRGRGHHIYMIQ